MRPKNGQTWFIVRKNKLDLVEKRVLVKAVCSGKSFGLQYNFVKLYRLSQKKPKITVPFWYQFWFQKSCRQSKIPFGIIFKIFDHFLGLFLRETVNVGDVLGLFLTFSKNLVKNIPKFLEICQKVKNFWDMFWKFRKFWFWLS